MTETPTTMHYLPVPGGDRCVLAHRDETSHLLDHFTAVGGVLNCRPLSYAVVLSAVASNGDGRVAGRPWETKMPP